MKILNKISQHEIKIMFLAILLAICGSLGIDIHLASLPHMMTYMHTDKQLNYSSHL